MIVRWPGKIRAGKISDFVWSQYDLFSTFADLAKTKTPMNLDGISILPIWLNKQLPNRKYLYWEFHEGGFLQAVRMEKWKAVRKGGGGRIELYDLEKDVAETHDVAVNNPKIVEQIATIMKREHVESPIWPDKDK